MDTGLVPVSFKPRAEDSFDVSIVRQAIRGQTKVLMDYGDETGNITRRTVWPFLIAYSEDIRMVCAWCELRQDFRHFRTDRVKRQEMLDERFPERVATLRKRWKDQREKLRT